MKRATGLLSGALLNARLSSALITLIAALTLMSATASAQVSVTATAGTVGPTPYTTLGGAFTAINAGTHQGAITIDITANTTEGTTPATLNSSGAGSASYTSVLIRPTADGVSISGNPVTGFGVIQLNGADNVTIDGDNPNTGGINRNLTVSNTTTTTVIANSAIRIATSAAVTSADNNTIKNCILLGNVTAGNAAAITSTTGSSNSSFGIYVGGNGGATAIGAPTAITSVTANSAPTGTTINNLLIDNNTINQCARAVVFNGAVATVSTGVTVSNNVIGDQGAATPATPPFTSPTTTVYTKGIWVAGTAAVTVSGNTLKNIMSYVGTTITAIEMVSPITASTISNNTATNIANNGTVSIVKAILISSTTGAYSIVGNTVTNVQSLASASGTDAIEVTAASPSGTIERNKVQTVYGRSAGTFGAYGINLTSGTGIVIKNNFVTDINMDMTGGVAFSTTFSVHGIRIAGGTNHKVYHNSVNLFGTLFGTATSSILTSAFTPTLATITGLDVRNNIFSNTLTGGTTSIAHVSIFLPSSATSAMNLTLNNNDYFAGTTAGSTGIAHVGTIYTAVPAGPPTYAGLYTAANFDPTMTTPSTNLRAYTSTLSAAGTNDNASKVVDPQFVSSTDLHIAVASPMVDAGNPAVGVLDDIDSQLRVGNPDIGADEPSGVTPPPNDISAIAIITPAPNSFVANGSSVSPQASFKNVGSATQNGVMVQFTITGPGGFNYSDTQAIATITPNQTVTVTFAATPAFTTPGTYSSTATVATADANSANDSVNASFTVFNAITGGSVNVGTGEAYTSLTNPAGIFDAINAGVVTSNITVNITSDLTAETGAIALNEFAVGFTVTIKPSGAARSISGSSTVGIIRLNGADNVTIDGSLTGGSATGVGGDPALRNLTVQNTSTTATAGGVIIVQSGTNGAQNNTVRNINVSGQDPTQTLIGIALGGATPGSAGTDNDNNRVENCSIQKAFLGIYNVGASLANQNTANVLTMNDMSATGANRLRRGGILVFNQNGIQITLNSIGGIIDDEAIDVYGIGAGTQNVTTTATTGGGITNAVISRNKINGIASTSTVGFTAAGIALAGDTGGTNTISNNMISGVIAPATAPDIVAGIFVAGVTGSNTQVYFNSVSITGDRGAVAGQIGSYGIAISGTNPVVELKDNIFYNTQTSGGGADAKSYAIGMTTTTFTNLSSDFNDFFTSGANAAGFRTGSLDATGTDHANLAAWQTATTKDASSLEVDPLYVNSTNDLHLQPTSPLLSVGTPIAGITNDFDNDPRPAVNPDIGADELIPPPATTSGQLIISEFRLRGPGGVNDEFIELYNTTGAALTVQAADASAGLAVAASDGVARCVIPNGTVIPAGGHFLCTNAGAYSLAGYPAGNGTFATSDLPYALDIPDNAGIAIFNNSTGGASFSIANRLDAVGSASEANLTYKEGTGYPDLVTTITVEHSVLRNLISGVPKDTGDNVSDFVFVDTQATCLFIAGCASGATADGNIGGRHLGAPGPENLSSPIQRNATIKAFLIDIGCSSSSGAGVLSNTTCARHRDLTVGPLATNGTLSIRRNFKNNTGVAVTRLRFRAVDLTTNPPPVGTADLRLLTSGSYSATCVSTGGGCVGTGSVITIEGTALETPPAQPNGGGLNSSMSAGTITLGTPLTPGASINLQFLLGVQSGGSYRFFINVEALP